MSIRRRLPNPILPALHPGILPGGVARIVFVGPWSTDAESVFATVRRGFPNAWVIWLAPKANPLPVEMSEVWAGDPTDPAVAARAREARLDLVVPFEPYDLMGDTRPELERFALLVGARAVAVYETTYGMVRIARRAHLRYRLYVRPWVCRVFGGATLTLLVAPLYGIYVVARWLRLWPSIPATEDRA